MKPSEFGLRLRQFRKLKGWSEEKLAAESGVPRSTIHSYEDGSAQKSSSPYLFRLANALGVDPELLAGVSDRVENPEYYLDAYLRIRSVTLPVYDGVDESDMREPVDFVAVRYDRVADRRYRAIVITGDALAPEVQAGDIVLLDRDVVLQPGDMVVCHGRGKIHCGRVILTQDGLMCQNNEHILPLEQCRPFGEIVHLVRLVRRNDKKQQPILIDMPK